MKILIISDNRELRDSVYDLFRSFDSNAIISVSDERGVEVSEEPGFVDFDKALKQSWTVVVRIVSDKMLDAEPLKIETLQTHKLVTEEKDSVDDILKVASDLYNDKIRYAGQACTCGANDYCKCH